MIADANLLFAAHRDGVFRYLCRIVGYGDAGEFTQEVFLRVARGPVPDTSEGSTRAWVFSIARKPGPQPRPGRQASASWRSKCLIRCAAPGTQELTAALRQALERLPALDRDVFLMREAGGLSYDEIAGGL